MTRRAAYDGDVIGRRNGDAKVPPSALPSLFDPPHPVPTAATPPLRRVRSHATRAERDEKVRRLVEIALDLATAAGTVGITVDEIREAASARGVIPAVGVGRQLSFLSNVPRAAGLVNAGRYRRSKLAVTHGNLQTVWRLPEIMR